MERKTLVASLHVKTVEPVNLDLQRKNITVCVLQDSWVAFVQMILTNAMKTVISVMKTLNVRTQEDPTDATVNLVIPDTDTNAQMLMNVVPLESTNVTPMPSALTPRDRTAASVEQDM